MIATSCPLPPVLQGYFTDRLMRERAASPHTVASYRDTFRLLLSFAHREVGRPPVDLAIEDLDAPLISSFLHYLEADCENTPRTRNQRLAAIKSFFNYVSFLEPQLCAQIQRILALPSKKHDRAQVEYLTAQEAEAVLRAPDLITKLGRRDHALILVGIQTGLRVSEITGLRCQDVYLGTGAHVRCFGKGRKTRCTPLTPKTVKVVRTWLRERGGAPQDFLFPSVRESRLSSDGVQYLLDKHVRVARHSCESLGAKRVTPHVLRHTAAMNLLQAGVDRGIIAIWLGHESVETTQIYLDANMAMKEAALAKTAQPHAPGGRFKPDDELMQFLKNL